MAIQRYKYRVELSCRQFLSPPLICCYFAAVKMITSERRLIKPMIRFNPGMKIKTLNLKTRHIVPSYGPLIRGFLDSKFHGANMGPVWGRQENIQICSNHTLQESFVTSFPSPLDMLCRPMALWLQASLITSFMGPTWGPSGADMTQIGPILAPFTLLSGIHRPVQTQTNIWHGHALAGV